MRTCHERARRRPLTEGAPPVVRRYPAHVPLSLSVTQAKNLKAEAQSPTLLLRPVTNLLLLRLSAHASVDVIVSTILLSSSRITHRRMALLAYHASIMSARLVACTCKVHVVPKRNCGNQVADSELSSEGTRMLGPPQTTQPSKAPFVRLRIKE